MSSLDLKIVLVFSLSCFAIVLVTKTLTSDPTSQADMIASISPLSASKTKHNFLSSRVKVVKRLLSCLLDSWGRRLTLTLNLFTLTHTSESKSFAIGRHPHPNPYPYPNHPTTTATTKPCQSEKGEYKARDDGVGCYCMPLCLALILKSFWSFDCRLVRSYLVFCLALRLPSTSPPTPRVKQA